MIIFPSVTILVSFNCMGTCTITEIVPVSDMVFRCVFVCVMSLFGCEQINPESGFTKGFSTWHKTTHHILCHLTKTGLVYKHFVCVQVLVLVLGFISV